jgi:hypothetical protein
VETRTAGSASGLEKRTNGNADTALQADSTGSSSSGNNARSPNESSTSCVNRSASRKAVTPEPSAGITDSQSAKGADTVGKDSRGYDAGKKINVRKRFIVTDTLGLLVVVCVMSAAWQDRDGAKTTLLSTYLSSPIRFVFADQGFAGRLVDWAAGTPENDGRDRA